MTMKHFWTPVLLFLAFLVCTSIAHAQIKNLLTPEEKLWLSSRNNTIVVYPELNNPPYTYQSASGNFQGLSIDYLELIAEKIGAKIQYLTPRSRVQIIEDVQKGKGDVIAALTPDRDREAYLLFTESYIEVPSVIVVRKDTEKRMGLTLNDFTGKRVAVIEGSALQSYVQTNYPRIVLEEVTDDEISLQQLVLGEVDAALMDVASLSYYLSKQVLSSVKIAGNTGFQYAPSFAMTKDKQILQSILEKGFTQVSANDRALLIEKWIAVPGQEQKNNSLWIHIQDNMGVVTLALLIVVGIIAIVVAIVRHRHLPFGYVRKRQSIDSLKDEISELEYASKELAEELENIQGIEKEIKDKIKEIH